MTDTSPSGVSQQPRTARGGTLVLIATVAAVAVPAVAQGPMGPAPVGYTEVIERSIRGSIRLTGSVAARRSSVVASEVEGLVVALEAREGDRVRRGQPIARLRRETLQLRLSAAEAELREAEARLELAVRNLARAEDLFSSGVISRQQLDDAQSEFDAWHGRKDRLAAEIARTRDDLERSAIRAPFGGVVVEERTEVGEWIGQGDPVVELVDLSELEVQVEVPERQFAGLRVGAPARVRFESLPGLEVEGEVSAIIPRADPRARTFPVKVRLPNPEGRIGVGMLAQVALTTGAARPATLVPKDAIVRQGGRTLVYLMDGSGGESSVRPVDVETGTSEGAWIAVDADLSPGQRVVVRGNERLQPGQPVQGTPVEYDAP